MNLSIRDLPADILASYEAKARACGVSLGATLSRNSSVSYCFFVSAYTLPRAFCAA